MSRRWASYWPKPNWPFRVDGKDTSIFRDFNGLEVFLRYEGMWVMLDSYCVNSLQRDLKKNGYHYCTREELSAEAEWDGWTEQLDKALKNPEINLQKRAANAENS